MKQRSRRSRPGGAEGGGGGARPGSLSALLQKLARAPEAPAREGPAPLAPGAVVGRFELVRELGHGGFGVVYEARDRELGRLVAFKAVRAGRHRDLLAERILCEAEAAARLSHPNVVTLFDVGRSEHGPYLVMELLRGETLADRLDRGPLAPGEALRVAGEVAKGLAHAHGHGVVHRDLKPGNVFLCEDGQVKVLDLGLAHAFGHRRADGGTPAYMAPEQRRGAPEDERTDVWALGILIVELLAGAPPAPGQGPPRAPALALPGDPAVAALVARMLAPDPVERPRDAGEVAAALAALAPRADRAEAPPRLDPAVAARIEARAAAVLGPLAHHLARTASARASTPRALGEVFAAFIPSGGDRDAFLRSCDREARDPPSGAGGASGGRTSSGGPPQAWDPAVLERAAAELAVYIGPVARVLVSRAAARAGSRAELYTLLAGELASARDRAAFEALGRAGADGGEPAPPGR